VEDLPGLGSGVKNLVSVTSGVNEVISAKVMVVVSFERRLTITFIKLHSSFGEAGIDEGFLDVTIWIVLINTHGNNNFFFFDNLLNFSYWGFFFSLSRRYVLLLFS